MLVSPQLYWFALTVKPRHEKAAAQNLRTKGLEDFLPLYRAQRHWSDRIQPVDLPLFPGYVFSRFTFQDRLDVRSTPSVLAIVGFAGTPAPLGDDEIAAIQTIVHSGLPVEPWPYVRIGQTVRIEEGALAGLKGTLVREKTHCRVVVNVELLQRSVAVEIDRSMLVIYGSIKA